MIPTILLPSLTTCLGDALKASQLHGTSVKRFNLTAGPKTLQYIHTTDFYFKAEPKTETSPMIFAFLADSSQISFWIHGICAFGHGAAFQKLCNLLSFLVKLRPD